MSSDYVSTGAAAMEFGVSSVTLQRWAAAGTVKPAYRTPGGHLRWDLDDLRRQLQAEPAENTSNPSTE